MKLAALAFIAVAGAASAPAQTEGLLNFRTGHIETVQAFSAPKFAIGHGTLKSYWRLTAFTGIDASQVAVSQGSTLYGGGIFYQGHVKLWTWDTHLTLVAGLAGQWEWKGKPTGGLYAGLTF